MTRAAARPHAARPHAARLAPRVLLALCALLAAPSARAFHSPHDVLTGWAISPDFAQDHTLFVAAHRFRIVLRSTDGGLSYESVSAGLQTGNVQALAISPRFAEDRTLYLSEDDWLYRTTSAGDRWLPLEAPEELAGVQALAVDADGALVVATSRSGLWRRAPDGAWSRTHAPDEPAFPPLFSLTLAPDGRTALCGSVRGGLWRARPGAARAERIATPVTAGVAAALAVPAADDRAPAALYVGTRGSGVLRSLDDGVTWSWFREGLTDPFVVDLATALDDDGTRLLFAATKDAGVFVSRDGGPWALHDEGLREQTPQTDQHYAALLPSPAYAEDGMLYLAGFEGLHSSHAGKPWVHLEVLPGTLVRNLALSPSFADDRRFWLSTYGYGLLATEDAGRSFRRVDDGRMDYPDALGVSPGGTVAYGVPWALFMSSDGGASWDLRRPDPRAFTRVIAFAPDYAESGTVLAHASRSGTPYWHGVFRSDDRGLTWEQVGERKIDVFAYAPDWAESGRVWAAGPEGVLLGTERGAVWTRLEDCPATHPVHMAVRGVGEREELLVCNIRYPGSSLFLSRDGGASWAPANEGIEGLRPTYVGFGGETHAFAATYTEGVFVSTDGGRSWRPTAPGPRAAFSFEVSRDFARDRTLIVGDYAGAWISEDAGESWRLARPTPDGEARGPREPLDRESEER